MGEPTRDPEYPDMIADPMVSDFILRRILRAWMERGLREGLLLDRAGNVEQCIADALKRAGFI